ncbi:TetR/AcrR family transcriptional regulator [Chelatococcus sambhunathii]|uniref:TetR/AcrR family transcriptional regulator n=1 Tax=Chelatococcus sambhunathii TaxID=363953 RepID=A0ABU1DH02_9HYPH|nr:TetR/AcrR family transcriptional regulator [Chelatococcus sambhunathii]MDR4307341.1 TetR/AcrR family transcriptional regulator [Chelatococcus sambhunathii]
MPRMVAERTDVLPALGECFREHGFEGASLALIGAATGLGKGSLYHFFPGGKAEMAAAVLAEIDGWFEREVFAPLKDSEPPDAGIAAMFEATETYFRSGRRVCLVGCFALGDVRDRFAEAVRSYFQRWIDALRLALQRAGASPDEALRRAVDVVGGIQGAIVLSRALDDPGVFSGMLARMRRDLTEMKPSS